MGAMRKRRGTQLAATGSTKRAGRARPAGGRPPRRWVWPIVAVLGLAAVAGTATWGLSHLVWGEGAARGGQPLNLLLITVDTTRADYLGCYGRADAQTPNIDRLAREGARFERCDTCVPLTLPSHASIMTGLYPYVHGARRNGTDSLSPASITLTTLAEALHQAGWRTQATIASYVLNACFGLSQGFDVYHDVVPRGGASAPEAERKGDEVCQDALGLLQALAPQPFFLWVHFFDPHFPYESPRGLDPGSPRAYADEIAFMDRQIGRLLEGLRTLKLEKKTLVVLVGDHGESLSEHGEDRHGFFLYQAALHVPLILRCPGVIPARQTIAAQVRTIDVAPTILDLLGCAPWSQAQGISLVPLLSGRQADLHLVSYAETGEGHALFALSRLRSLTVGKWKYVLAPRPELYDLEHDAAEVRNLVKEQADLAADLREQLRQLLADSPPSVEQSAPPALSPADRARLESLGYVGSTAGPADTAQTELDRFEPRGGDPKDYAQAMAKRGYVSGALSKGDYASAESLLRELVTMFPEVPVLQAELAEAVLQQGRLDEALSIQQAALDLATRTHPQLDGLGRSLPDLTRAQLWLAAALRRADRIEEAMRAYELTVRLDPDCQPARQVLGNFLLSAGRFEAAVQQLAVAVKLMPDDIDTLHDLSVCLIGLNRLDEAEPYLVRAIQLAPKIARVYQALGLLRWRQKRLPEAVQCFRKTLELEPNSPQAQAALQRVQKEMTP